MTDRYFPVSANAYGEMQPIGKNYRLRLVNERNRHASLKPSQVETLGDALETGLSIFDEITAHGRWPMMKFFDLGHRAMMRFTAHGREDLRLSIHESTEAREWILTVRGLDKVRKFKDWVRQFTTNTELG